MRQYRGYTKNTCRRPQGSISMIKWHVTEVEERRSAGQRGLRHTGQGLSEAKMHRERKWKNTFRPCEALCAPVTAFADRSGIRVPLRQFFTALGACEGRLGEGSIYAPTHGNMEERLGRKVCRLKGLCCFRQPNPGKHRPAKPCGIVSLNTFRTVRDELYACGEKMTDTCGKAGDSKVLDERKIVWQREKVLCGG